jgi:hypothetical protein
MGLFARASESLQQSLCRVLSTYWPPPVLLCSRWIRRSSGLAAGFPNPAGAERAFLFLVRP